MPYSDSSSVDKKRREILDYLNYLLENEMLAPGECLPSQNELSERFETNRNTVRSALTALCVQGKIYSHKGKGYFVVRKPSQATVKVDKSLGLSESINRDSSAYACKLLALEKRIVTKEESKLLKLSKDLEVYDLKQLRYMNGAEFAVCRSVIPAALLPDLEEKEEELAGYGFKGTNHIFIDLYGLSHPVCTDVKIQAVLPNSEQIKLLNITESIPLIRQENIYSIPEMGFAEYFEILARGDMYKIEMQL